MQSTHRSLAIGADGALPSLIGLGAVGPIALSRCHLKPGSWLNLLVKQQ